MYDYKRCWGDVGKIQFVIHNCRFGFFILVIEFIYPYDRHRPIVPETCSAIRFKKPAFLRHLPFCCCWVWIVIVWLLVFAKKGYFFCKFTCQFIDFHKKWTARPLGRESVIRDIKSPWLWASAFVNAIDVLNPCFPNTLSKRASDV